MKGGATEGGPAGGGQPHRRAGQRRPGLRRRVPPGRRDPGGHRRGGLRGGGHLRHPAAAGRAERRGADDRRRLGRRHRRRHHRDRDLTLLPLPDDLRAAIDAKLPPRWSRNNPVDCAGGETRDTIPEVLALVAAHPDVARGRLPRHRHPVEPGPADARRARSTPTTAWSASSPTTSARTPASPRPRPRSASATGKPILTATELAVADPDNPGPAAVRVRAALLRVGRPGRHRARAPLPLRTVADPEGLERAPARAAESGEAQPERLERSIAADREARRRRGRARTRPRGPGRRRSSSWSCSAWSRRWGCSWPTEPPLSRAEQGQPVAPTPTPPVGRVVTPLASIRRTPTAMSQALATEALVASLAPIGEQVAPASCLVVGVDGAPVFDDGGSTSVIPASNMKLVTAAVGLEVLGPEHRFTTEARTDAAPVDGVVAGQPLPGRRRRSRPRHRRLRPAAAAQVIHPQPYVTPLETLADQIVAAGVTTVQRVRRGRRQPLRRGALRSVLAVQLRDHSRGRSARRAARQRRCRIAPAAAQHDRPRGPRRHRAHPAAPSARRDRRRPARSGRHAATAAPLTAIQSRPLGELVGEMLTNSDDNTAELLLKEIGLVGGGAGTRPAGLGVVQAKLAEWGIAPRRSCPRGRFGARSRQPADLWGHPGRALRHVGGTGPVADGLPVAGQTGTLSDAFAGNPAVGRLRAEDRHPPRRQGAVGLRRRAPTEPATSASATSRTGPTPRPWPSRSGTRWDGRSPPIPPHRPVDQLDPEPAAPPTLTRSALRVRLCHRRRPLPRRSMTQAPPLGSNWVRLPWRGGRAADVPARVGPVPGRAAPAPRLRGAVPAAGEGLPGR